MTPPDGEAMSDPDWLADLKGRPHRTIAQWEGDLNRLIREVEQLLDENHLLNGFAADHGHDRCIAEIRRLREELAYAQTWIARMSPDYEAAIAWARETNQDLTADRTIPLEDLLAELNDEERGR